MDDFKGRTIFVTGGTGALGSAVVGAALARAASCVVPWIEEREADAFPHKGHERVRLVGPVDLADEARVERLYAGLDSLWASIHCAGGFAMSPVEKTSLADFRGQLDMNAVSCFLSVREAVRRFDAQGRGGRIVNVAARPALFPELGAQMAAYGAAKGVVASLTQSVNAEVSARGVLVNAVVPSIMDTPANRAAMPDADHASWASVEAVAATILFLASPLNTATGGALVPVYGGASG